MEFLKSTVPSSPFLPKVLLKLDKDEVIKYVSKAKDMDFVYHYFVVLEWVFDHVPLFAYICK